MIDEYNERDDDNWSVVLDGTRDTKVEAVGLALLVAMFVLRASGEWTQRERFALHAAQGALLKPMARA